jgi:hypothetical protein
MLLDDDEGGGCCWMMTREGEQRGVLLREGGVAG